MLQKKFHSFMKSGQFYVLLPDLLLFFGATGLTPVDALTRPKLPVFASFPYFASFFHPMKNLDRSELESLNKLVMAISDTVPSSRFAMSIRTDPDNRIVIHSHLDVEQLPSHIPRKNLFPLSYLLVYRFRHQPDIKELTLKLPFELYKLTKGKEEFIYANVSRNLARGGEYVPESAIERMNGLFKIPPRRLVYMSDYMYEIDYWIGESGKPIPYAKIFYIALTLAVLVMAGISANLQWKGEYLEQELVRLRQMKERGDNIDGLNVRLGRKLNEYLPVIKRSKTLLEAVDEELDDLSWIRSLTCKDTGKCVMALNTLKPMNWITRKISTPVNDVGGNLISYSRKKDSMNGISINSYEIHFKISDN